MRTLFAYGVVVTLLLVVGRVRLLPKWGSSAMRAIQGDWLAYDFRFSFVRHLLKAVRLFVYSLVTLTAIGLLFSTPETGLSSFDTFVAGVVAVVTTNQISTAFESGYVSTLAFLDRTRADYLRGTDPEPVRDPVLVVVYTVLFAAGLVGGLVSATLLFPVPRFSELSGGVRVGVYLILLVVGFLGAVYDVYS